MENNNKDFFSKLVENLESYKKSIELKMKDQNKSIELKRNEIRSDITKFENDIKQNNFVRKSKTIKRIDESMEQIKQENINLEDRVNIQASNIELVYNKFNEETKFYKILFFIFV